MTEKPPAEWIKGPCPDCGAVTLKEAETRCRPQSDQTGEVFCPTTDAPETGGFVHVVNPAYVKWLDAKIDAEMRGEHQPAQEDGQ